ncbi:hypothetical protein BDR07DRAFT_1382705 [Suillus spraguei]|nr:hypothetical protein BDR07DRAFT_1382705 [Suillus spraguei]
MLTSLSISASVIIEKQISKSAHASIDDGQTIGLAALKKSAHAGIDASQTIGLAGNHKTRRFPSHADGLGSISYALLPQPNSTVTSLGGHDIDHGVQQANLPITSAWLKPLHIKAPQPSKTNVAARMQIHQSTQHLQRTDPPIYQAKPTPKAGKKADKKKEEKTEKDEQVIQKKEVGKKAADYRQKRVAQSAAKNCVHTGADTSQTIDSAGDHKTRGFPSHVDGLGSASSCALLQSNSIVTSLCDPDIDREGQQANLSVSSAWSKPLHIKEAPQASKTNMVVMPICRSTQHLQRMDPPIAQGKSAPKAGKNGGKNADKNGGKNTDKNGGKNRGKNRGKNTDKNRGKNGGKNGGKNTDKNRNKNGGKKADRNMDKKKQKPFYKEVKKEIREPAYWKKKAEEDACLLNIAKAIWTKKVGKKAAVQAKDGGQEM